MWADPACSWAPTLSRAEATRSSFNGGAAGREPALAEENAAASEELNAQAEVARQQVQRLEAMVSRRAAPADAPDLVVHARSRRTAPVGKDVDQDAWPEAS